VLAMIYYVYILASKRNGTLYIGVTNDLQRRVYEHKAGLLDGFTKRYGVHMLVHFEQTNDIQAALQREKQLKKWNRAWKIRLIEETNPGWKDMSLEWDGLERQGAVDSRLRGNDILRAPVVDRKHAHVLMASCLLHGDDCIIALV
jgi:putative endonuclease